MRSATPASNPTTPSTRSLILVPAILTLLVTIVRLVGELQGWSPKYFNSDAGGHGAIVGIVWLAPLFGIWFARRLLNAGAVPSSRGRAILWPLAGVALVAGAAFGIGRSIGPKEGAPTDPMFVCAIQGAFLVGALVACIGWPRLALVDFAYGLAARIPVALLMLIAMNAKWGTHYEKGVPGLPQFPLFQEWLLIGLLPQVVGWVSFTIISGGLLGGLSLLIGSKEAPAPAAPAPAHSQTT
jgi:ABC-type branched-subunit amino acid transport system permease subunit